MNPMLPYKVLFLDWKRRDCNTPILPPRRTRCGGIFIDILRPHDPRGSARAMRCSRLAGQPDAADLRRNSPETTPTFSVYSPGEPTVYPYTMRSGFTKRRVDHGWRTLRLENEYLSCTVLPDLAAGFTLAKIN